jgi:hypothetical protein
MGRGVTWVSRKVEDAKIMLCAEFRATVIPHKALCRKVMHFSRSRIQSLPGNGCTQFYLSNCGMGGRIARPGQRFSDTRPTRRSILSTGNYVIPVRRL